MDDDVFSIEVEENGSIEDIKVLICAYKNIDVEAQVLMHNQRILAFNAMKVQ